MRTPEDVLAWLRRKYSNHKQRWLDGAGEWPLTWPLERPNEQDALQAPGAVRAWKEAWASWTPPSSDVAVATETVKWSRLGTQTLPLRISFASPSAVATTIKELVPWQRAAARRAQLAAQWPTLDAAGLGSHFDVLAVWEDDDFHRLTSLLTWFDANPSSGLYLRQIPVMGIDTKWIGAERRGVVSDFLRRMRQPVELADGKSPALDFHERCGLQRPPSPLRIFLLSPELRKGVGGLRDLQAPWQQLAALELLPRRALIVENLETAYSLPDLPGTVAFVGLGNAVSRAALMSWMQGVPVVYWGDIDTFGFSILAQARKCFSDVTSTLMDEATLKAYLDRCILEPAQTANVNRSLLTEAEVAVYEGLLAGTWGRSLRLEQERLDWTYCSARLHQAVR